MNDNRQLAKNSIYNLGSFLINLFISFFFTPYLIKVVGKESYSFFPLVNNIISYSAIISTAIGGMAGRFITIKIHQNKIHDANYYYNSVLLANWILSALFTLISCLLIVLLPKILTIPQSMTTEVRVLFAFSCASMIVGLATNMLGLGTFIKNRLDMSASRTAISNILRVGIIIVLFSCFTPSIIYMSFSAFVASLFCMFYNISFKQKLLPEIPINIKKYFKWTYLKEIISSSIWSSVNQLGMILVTQLDLLITNIFIGVSATGDYSIAKMMPSLLISLIATLAGVFVPSFNILFAKNELSNLIVEINKSMKIMGLFSSIPIGFLIIYGQEFFNLWTPGQDNYTISLLSNLSLIPLIINGVVNPLFHIYAVTNKVRIPSLTFVAFGLIQTSLVCVCINITDWGIWTIPIISLFVNLIKLCTFVPMYAAYCLKLSIMKFYKPILQSIALCILTIFISYITINILPSNSWPYFIINGLIVSSITLAIVLYTFLDKTERSFILSKIKK